MTGGSESTTMTELVQKEALPQQSVAFQITVMMSWHGARVLVVAELMTMVTPPPAPEVFVQQLSVAVGKLNVHGVPHCTVWFGPQVMTGGTLSTMVTLWLQLVELPQQSEMVQLRVMMTGQFGAGLVVVLLMTMVGGFVQQSSIAVGGVKFHGEPQFTVMFGAQMTFGGRVSMICNRWVQISEVLVQQSVAVQRKV
jgi:hypothetical protein